MGERRRKPIAERFWSKVDKQGPNDCWEWTAYRNPNGYGMLDKSLSPRISWELHFGPIDDALNVMHRCDNPPCVNPAHLRLGTQLDNIADCVSKRRHKYGTRDSKAKLTDEMVREIRRRYAAGGINQYELGYEYGVAQGIISSVIRRVAWSHVEDA